MLLIISSISSTFFFVQGWTCDWMTGPGAAWPRAELLWKTECVCPQTAATAQTPVPCSPCTVASACPALPGISRSVLWSKTWTNTQKCTHMEFRKLGYYSCTSCVCTFCTSCWHFSTFSWSFFWVSGLLFSSLLLLSLLAASFSSLHAAW